MFLNNRSLKLEHLIYSWATVPQNEKKMNAKIKESKN